MATQEDKYKSFQRGEMVEGFDQLITPTAVAGELVGAVAAARAIRAGIGGAKVAAEAADGLDGVLDDVVDVGVDVRGPKIDMPETPKGGPAQLKTADKMKPPKRDVGSREAAEAQDAYAEKVELNRGRLEGEYQSQLEAHGPVMGTAEKAGIRGAGRVNDTLKGSAMATPALGAAAMGERAESGDDGGEQSMGAELADLADFILPEDLTEAALRSSPVLWAAYKGGLPLGDIANAIGAVMDSTPVKAGAALATAAMAPTAAVAGAAMAPGYMFGKSMKEMHDRPEWSTLKTTRKLLGRPTVLGDFDKAFQSALMAMPDEEVTAAFDAGLISDELHSKLVSPWVPYGPPAPEGAQQAEAKTDSPRGGGGASGNGNTWEGAGGYMYRNNPDGSFTIVKAPSGLERQIGIKVSKGTVNRQDPGANPHEAIRLEAIKRGAINE